jgi:hypothetical protein
MAYGNSLSFTEDWLLSSKCPEVALFSMRDNAKESLPPEMFEKVVYTVSWKYTP